MSDPPQPVASAPGSTAFDKAKIEGGRPGPGGPPRLVALEDLLALAERALMRVEVPKWMAGRVSDVLVDAEARGISSHGLVRLPSYVDRVKAGLIDIASAPALVKDEAGSALIDGANAFGVVAADLASDEAARRARRHGVGWVTAIHSNHLGSIGYFVRALARDGLIAVMWSNAAPSVAAYKGRSPILGTNPLAMAAPREPNPIVLDMATSTTARGRIRRALAEGQSIPLGWAVGCDGQDTRDPAAALKGALLPLGGAKGYGLSVFLDLLSGVVGGGASLDQVYETTELSKPADIAFSLLAFDPFRFIGARDYAVAVDDFTARLKGSGDGDVLLPGEPEDTRYLRAKSEGVAVAADIYRQLEDLIQ